MSEVGEGGGREERRLCTCQSRGEQELACRIT